MYNPSDPVPVVPTSEATSDNSDPVPVQSRADSVPAPVPVASVPEQCPVQHSDPDQSVQKKITAPDPDLSGTTEQPTPKKIDAKFEQQVSEVAQTEIVNTAHRTSHEQATALLALIEEGQSVREAAITVGVNLRTAYGLLARIEGSADAMRAATRQLMIAGSAKAIEHWQTAMQVGAQKKGNHAPARDWLLHAGVIDELSSDSANVKIAINIGTDDRPMKLVSPLSVKDE